MKKHNHFSAVAFILVYLFSILLVEKSLAEESRENVGLVKLAGRIFLWPQLRAEGSSPMVVRHVKMAPSGRFLAVTSSTGWQVWEVQGGGALGRKIWEGQTKFGRAVRLGCAWHQNYLIVSAIDNPVPQAEWLGYSDERKSAYYERLKNQVGQSYKVNPVDGTVKPIDGLLAYDELAISPSGKWIVAARTTGELVSSRPNMFEVVGDIVSVKAALRRMPTSGESLNVTAKLAFLIGWKSDSSGFFGTVKMEDKGKEDSLRTLAFWPVGGGEVYPIPLTSEVVQEHLFAPPFATLSNQGDLYIATQNRTGARFWNQVQGSIPGPWEYSWKRVYSAVKDKVQYGESIAVSPNGRYIVYQEFSNLSSGKKAPHVWIIDAVEKKRSMVVAGTITEVFGWWKGKMLMRFESTPDSEGANSQLGYLSLPEGDTVSNTSAVSVEARIDWESIFETYHSPKARKAGVVLDKIMSATDSQKLSLKDPIDGPLGTTFYFTLDDIGVHGKLTMDHDLGKVVAYERTAPRPPFSDAPIGESVALESTKRFLNGAIPSEGETRGPADGISFRGLSNEGTYIFAKPLSNGMFANYLEIHAGTGAILEYKEVVQTLPRIVQMPGEKLRLEAIHYATPVVSPDGRSVVFLSNEPRAGYPSWWANRRVGLYLVQLRAGLFTDATLLAPSVRSVPSWSPDGKKVTFLTDDALTVIVVNSGETRRLFTPKAAGVSWKPFCWLNDTDVLFGAVHEGPGGCDLMKWSFGSETPPTLVKRNWSDSFGNDWGSGSFACDFKARRIYFTWLRANDTLVKNPYTLLSMSMDNPASEVEMVYEQLPVGGRVHVLNSGILVTGKSRAVVVSGGKANDLPAVELPADTSLSDYSNVTVLSGEGDFLWALQSIGVTKQTRGSSLWRQMIVTGKWSQLTHIR